MDINIFIDELVKETTNRYLITYDASKKYYFLTLFNMFIGNHRFAISKRSLKTLDTSYKRMNEICEYMKKVEDKLNKEIKKLFGD